MEPEIEVIKRELVEAMKTYSTTDKDIAMHHAFRFIVEQQKEIDRLNALAIEVAEYKWMYEELQK